MGSRRIGGLGALAFVVLIFGLPVSSADWPQWRGPHGTGVAPHAKPVTEWSSEKNIRWKTRLSGRGHSTPIVSGNHIFVTAAMPIGPHLPPRTSDRPGAHDNLPVTQRHRFTVTAIDRNSGEVQWEKTVHESIPREGAHYTASLASASPVTDGNRLYASFGSYGLYCLDFDGNILWQKHFGQMHTKHGHGEGSSPALHDETLVVNWDHEESSFIVAIDTQSGNIRWRRDRAEVTSWSTPLITNVDGATQVIVCGTDRVRGYDLETGEDVWQCGGMSANIVATPVAENEIVYVGSSYEKRMLMAIRLTDARGDVTGSNHVIWSRARGTPYVPSPLLYEGALFYLAHYQNVITRVIGETGEDAPGAMRLGELGNVYASPVGAGGNVFITDLDGTTQVITNSDIPRTVAVNRLGEPISASMAIVDREIFLRGEEHLFCIAEE